MVQQVKIFLQCRRYRRHEFNPWVGKRKWQPILVFLPEQSHGQRKLVGCSPKDSRESDMTEHNWHSVGTK